MIVLGDVEWRARTEATGFVASTVDNAQAGMAE